MTYAYAAKRDSYDRSAVCWIIVASGTASIFIDKDHDYFVGQTEFLVHNTKARAHGVDRRHSLITSKGMSCRMVISMS